MMDVGAEVEGGERERERSRCGEKKAASIIYQPGVRVDGGIGKGWREE